MGWCNKTANPRGESGRDEWKGKPPGGFGKKNRAGLNENPKKAKV